MLRRLSIGLLASAVAMTINPLEAKSGNHEAGKVYEYEYLAEAHVACGNWSQNAIFYYSDKTFELTGANFSTNRICSPEKDLNQVVGEVNLSISSDMNGKTIKQENLPKDDWKQQVFFRYKHEQPLELIDPTGGFVRSGAFHGHSCGNKSRQNTFCLSSRL